MHPEHLEAEALFFAGEALRSVELSGLMLEGIREIRLGHLTISANLLAVLDLVSEDPRVYREIHTAVAKILTLTSLCESLESAAKSIAPPSSEPKGKM